MQRNLKYVQTKYIMSECKLVISSKIIGNEKYEYVNESSTEPWYPVKTKVHIYK